MSDQKYSGPIRDMCVIVHIDKCPRNAVLLNPTVKHFDHPGPVERVLILDEDLYPKPLGRRNDPGPDLWSRLDAHTDTTSAVRTW